MPRSSQTRMSTHFHRPEYRVDGTARQLVHLPKCRTQWPSNSSSDSLCSLLHVVFAVDGSWFRWMTNASHPGTPAYYDSVVAEYASSGIDFLYLDGILGTCEGAFVQRNSMHTA